ncbi:Variant-specific surface protein [Giardia duodenalis]|uniref:Variant-specific surface protein n=1 Tax=Giardia intestinalis TaxID=5741 RepID=V6TNN8_GIAIN|nr:Variant-specific surface protein [Giardia intestinalis]
MTCVATFVPINGVCAKAANNDKCKDTNGSTDADQTCKKCLLQTFMYKGGCYSTSDAPGSTMCKIAADGVCTVAADGNAYFVPPETDRDATKQSVIPCGDVEEITVKNDHKYKGVLHCTQCGTPNAASDTTTAVAATCTACEDGYFINGAACTACDEQCATCEDTNSDSKCKSCKEGYFLGAANGQQGKCIQCNNLEDQSWKGVQNCAKCTSSNTQNTPATCTECAENYYLKTNGGATSCVTAEQCGEGFFATTVENIKKCVSCSTTKNGGIENCAKCSLVPSSARAGVAVTCTECTSNKLSPLGDACLTACPAGTYETGDTNKVCTPCHASCSSCSDAGESSCTACYPGSVLNYGSTAGKGTCIPECTGKYAENCADGQCTASIAGSKYCSKCKSEYVPVDGVCVPAETARAAPAGCTPDKANGVCTACTNAYFLQSGGCYQAAVYPGNTLCTTAASGKCTSCANGQQVDSGTGSCPACDPTCKTCTTANDPTKCSACFSGYYLDAGKACKKCSETSGNIQGVENCISCVPPANNQGSVTCYVKTSGSNSTGGANLSSGAIAGISVAVITVVGGLVGSDRDAGMHIPGTVDRERQWNAI